MVWKYLLAISKMMMDDIVLCRYKICSILANSLQGELQNGLSEFGCRAKLIGLPRSLFLQMVSKRRRKMQLDRSASCPSPPFCCVCVCV